MGDLLSLGIRPLTGPLSINTAGIGSTWPIGVEHIINKARNTSLLVSKHVCIMCFISFTYITPCPFCWWLYDDGNGLMDIQATVDVLLLFWNKIYASIRHYFSQKSLLCKYNFTHFDYTICIEFIHLLCNWNGNLQYTSMFYYSPWSSLYLLFPMACLVCHVHWFVFDHVVWNSRHVKRF